MTMVLVVDDIPALTEQYAYDLKRLGGYEVVTAIEGGKALELLRSAAVDCMILDLEMPGMDGFEVLRRLEQQGSEVPVIVYTGTGNYERCVAALKLGAYSFIDKAEPMERVVHEVETVLERKRLRQELMALERRLGIESSLVGSSVAVRALQEAIGRVARIPSPVLILGESGTGKELVARDLHRSGLHPEAPFLAVNSAALPENLIESELFGHERGAFTGATATRKGAFEAAGRGTLFLDEIGELPLTAQAKLLRVLENREVVRLGATRPISIEARIIAATNRNLEAGISAGHFRSDLYYRLNVHLLNVPPRISRHAARFVSRADRDGWLRDRAETAMSAAVALLTDAGVPHEKHWATGERAEQICRAAKRLGVHHIVMGTARKNSITRMLEDSMTHRLLETTPVPVEVIAGDAVSKWERWGLPVGALGLGGLLVLAVD